MKLNFGTRDAVLVAAIKVYYDRLNEKYPGKTFVFYDDKENPDVIAQTKAAIAQTGSTRSYEFIHISTVPDVVRPAIVPTPADVEDLKEFRIKGFYCYMVPEITPMEGFSIDSELLTTLLSPGPVGPMSIAVVSGLIAILKKCGVEAFKRTYHDIVDHDSECLDTCTEILEENDPAEVIKKAEEDLDLIAKTYFQTPNTRQFVLVEDGEHE